MGRAGGYTGVGRKDRELYLNNNKIGNTHTHTHKNGRLKPEGFIQKKALSCCLKNSSAVADARCHLVSPRLACEDEGEDTAYRLFKGGQQDSGS